MTRALAILGLLTLVGFHDSPAAAQQPKKEPGPNARVASPEVHPDRKVTFRIRAPKATEVSVRGDWMASAATLEKDSNGVWSVTVGPLTPDFYSYAFTVDGVRTLDPSNPTIKQGIASLDNMFFLTGPEADFQDNKPVPHGDVRKVWYQSATLKDQRRMHIYTPPGYDTGAEKYPVFYLLHGGGDEDSGWSTVGRVGFILDNLIAAKRARPMIVVMPNGSLPRPAVAPGAKLNPKEMAAFQERFTNELLTDVVPQVEKHFRVKPGPENRALAGLSMGGGQTTRVLTTRPDQFGYVAIWSAGLFGGDPAGFERQSDAFLKNATGVNKSLRLLEITVGDKDFALAGSKALSGVFAKHGIKHELKITGGGHTWLNWRQYLNELAPKLFQ
ncbi:MAG TPA: alpha/beta hydrolase-fold protein [Gemmataceae bacterium]|jgi:enterochelin esterase family protein|nr:alpha/beta hydrolase-fold protein [Gemmataceae bacterium]